MNYYGQTDVPATATNVVAIAGGEFHSLALKADGTIIAWGGNGVHQTEVPTTATNVVAIAAGKLHSLAVRADGTVVAWGAGWWYNPDDLYSFGQSITPNTATNVVAVAGGGYHSLALKADGTVVAWGRYFEGQTTFPGAVTNVVAIAGSGYHSLALKADGTVVGWGTNDFGQTSVPSFARTLLATGGTVNTNVADTYPLTYSFTNSSGTVQTTNRTVVVVDPPVISSQPANVTAFVGTSAQLTVTAAGTPPLSYQWYWAHHGAIAHATNATLAWSSLTTSDVGNYYVVVSNTYGTVTSQQTWVAPLNWQWIGANPLTNFNAVFTDLGATLTMPVVAIAGGSAYNLALKADGTVVGWGYNSDGETNVPPSATNVVAVAAGKWFSLALKVDGTVVGWGWNGYGETNVPASATNVVAVAAGGWHSLALKADGTVVGWGDNFNGQTNVPASVTNVVAIAGGSDHSLALKADGTVVAWGAGGPGQSGYPHFGQSTVPATATNVVAIAGGEFHSLALKADGMVVAWGDSTSGQTVVPATATNVVAIAAGHSHSLALKADGTVVAWGSNSDGQIDVPSFAQSQWATSGTVNTNISGIYTLTYSYTNRWGAVLTTNRTVVVEVELVGFDTTSDHLGIITARGEHGTGEGMAMAFDDNLAWSKWLDFSPEPARATWIQYEYASGRSYSLSGYTLTSADDAPERDPKTWILEGSNDGTNYFQIDSQTGQTFSDRLTKNTYALGMTAPYHMYRLRILSVLDPDNANSCQLGEIELIGISGGTPWITQPPENVYVLPGMPASFRVEGEGSLPLSFQWCRNPGVPLAGQTNDTLAWTSVPTNDFSGYFVVLSNAFGSITSSVAYLIPPEPPAITRQPQSLIVGSGAAASFQVTASGTAPLVCRWQKDGVSLGDSANRFGTATTNLTWSTTTTNDGGSYRVIVTNLGGCVTSSVARLHMVKPGLVVGFIDGFGGTGTGWTLNRGASGDTPTITNNALTITTLAYSEANSAFCTTPPKIVGDFLATFTWTLVDDNDGWPADGFMFTIQNQSSHATADGGGSLGYAGSPGISPSVAIGLANFINPRLQLGINGEFDYDSTIDLSGSGLDFHTENQPVRFAITYTASSRLLSVTMVQGAVSLTYSFTLPAPLDTLLGSDTAYVGFTGGTGGAAETQIISEFSFMSYGSSWLLPQLRLAITGNGVSQLTWPPLDTVPPVGYQVQTSTNLSATNWLDLGGVIPVNPGSMSVTNPLGSDRQRFYRLLLVP